MQKYDPPIEVTTVRSMNPSIVWDEGESYERNGVYAAYENDLGIKIRNLWSVDSSQYDQKVNIAIASGDIPDLMQVNSVQFQQLLDADMIMDIGEAFEKYATPYTKEYVTRDGGGQLDEVPVLPPGGPAEDLTVEVEAHAVIVATSPRGLRPPVHNPAGPHTAARARRPTGRR